MKKRLAIIIALLLLTAALVAPVLAAKAMIARTGVFYPVYWILGGAESSNPAKTVDGRLVVVYIPDYSGNVAKLFGYGYISGTTITINPFRVGLIGAGQTYKVAIARGDDNYGSDPVDLTISGLGYERLPSNLLLAYGKGPIAPDVGATTEPAPKIKLWFGNRLYQKTLVEKGRKFVISSKPDIKLELLTDPPFTVAQNVDAHSVTVDEGTATARTLAFSAGNVAMKTYAAGTTPEQGKVVGLSLTYKFEEALPDGTHTFAVSARSSGALATASTATELATVEVMGGPTRLIGTPITFPSPFSISKQKIVTIQYELSGDANIEIYITGVSGLRVKHYIFSAGTEGGSAGVNKVTWNGQTDQGYLAGNAIYVGTIIAKDETRLLGKVKLTIVD